MSRKPRTKIKEAPAIEAGGGRVRIQIKNLGRIKSADIEIAPLTIIAGPNSTGKTYLNYLIYSILAEAYDICVEEDLIKPLYQQIPYDQVNREEIDQTRRHIEKSVGEIFEKRAPRYLSLSSERLSGLQVKLGLGPMPDHIKGRPRVALDPDHKNILTSDLDPEKLTTTRIDNGKTRPSDFIRTAVSAALGVLLTPVSELVFPITSERSGLAMFYRDLDLNKTRLLDEARSAEGNSENRKRLIDLLLAGTSRYAVPISDNIDIIRDFEELIKQESFLVKDAVQNGVLEILDQLTGGSFTVSNGVIGFTLNGAPESHTPISTASSAAKSLLLFDIFFRHVATPGSMLVIDEPELNLHPANQRKMARLLVRAVNAGIKVLITTHSDWLIRELSSCIALHTKRPADPTELKRLTGATPADCLNYENVRAYQTTLSGVLESLPVDATGIETSSLDDAILDANLFYDKVQDLPGIVL